LLSSAAMAMQSFNDQLLQHATSSIPSDQNHGMNMSRSARIVELVGGSRCQTCRQHGKRCHVEGGASACMQCTTIDGCVFERLVLKRSYLADLTWNELVASANPYDRVQQEPYPQSNGPRQPATPSRSIPAKRNHDGTSAPGPTGLYFPMTVPSTTENGGDDSHNNDSPKQESDEPIGLTCSECGHNAVSRSEAK
jgi:hypothetical protein